MQHSERRHRTCWTVALALVCACSLAWPPPAVAGQETPAAPPMRWYKGNTHTHTLNSDGDSTPDEVVRWYREHRYDFLVLSDHNFLTSVDGLNALHGADEKFLVIRGEEVSSRADSKPIHVNGMNTSQVVGAQTGGSVVEVLQANIDAIRSASGVPHINHPNFQWALTTEDLRAARDYKLFELYNGHPRVNNVGGGGVPGLEDVWDQLLSSGMLVYGIAVDDAHTFKDPGNPMVAGPGRAWVMVRAPRLEAGALMESLEQGDFYSSTGVVLDEVDASTAAMTVKVRAEGVAKYRIRFIGRHGRLLSESGEPAATYRFKGDEGYVRATILESNGRMAWVQPVVVNPRSAAGAVWTLPALLAGLLAYRRPWRT